MTKRICVLIFLAGMLITPAALSQPPLAGTVKETMNSGGYTYILLEQGGQEIWVATTTADVKKGMSIELAPGMVMKNFESKSLNRVFDQIIFSAGIIADHTGHNHAPGEGHGGQTAMQGGMQSAPTDPIAALAQGKWSEKPSEKPTAMSGGSMPHSKPAAKKPSEPIKVEKASGANSFTVGEIFAQASGLNEKPVVIKGKVVKALSQIMGKNWIHIQDGTGDAAKNTHDIVITTQDMPKVGEVVTFAGTLYTNKDFGAGYAYPVIVEEASIVK